MTVEELVKRLDLNKYTILRTVDKLSGLLWIDMREGETYKKLCGPILDVRQSMYNKRRNLPKVPPYMKAPYLFCSATT